MATIITALTVCYIREYDNFCKFLPLKLHANTDLINRNARMAEWSKALVLGTSHFGGLGLNPASVIIG